MKLRFTIKEDGLITGSVYMSLEEMSGEVECQIHKFILEQTKSYYRFCQRMNTKVIII